MLCVVIDDVAPLPVAQSLWSNLSASPDTLHTDFSFSRMNSSRVILLIFSLIDIVSGQQRATTGLGSGVALCPPYDDGDGDGDGDDGDDDDVHMWHCHAHRASHQCDFATSTATGCL